MLYECGRLQVEVARLLNLMVGSSFCSHERYYKF